MSNGSWVMGYRLQVYWTMQQHLDLALRICRVVKLVVSSEPEVSPGSMQGVTLVATASKSFASSAPRPHRGPAMQSHG